MPTCMVKIVSFMLGTVYYNKKIFLKKMQDLAGFFF